MPPISKAQNGIHKGDKHLTILNHSQLTLPSCKIANTIESVREFKFKSFCLITVMLLPFLGVP